MASQPIQECGIFDVLGCGFGPANLAIAAALTDKWAIGEAKHIQRAIFVEKHQEFLWHPGMLLPGSRMQISCLKDLVTLRNPVSPLTFLSYLHSQKRLLAFINRGSTIPTRREFADYLSWAADEVRKRGVHIAYGEEVVGITKIPTGDDNVELIDVTSRQLDGGGLITRRTRHLILSPGGSPRVPTVLSSLLASHPLCSKVNSTLPIVHSSSYMTSVARILDHLSSNHRPLKVAIVGSGQSSAECLLDIHGRLAAIPPVEGGHEIHMIIRKGSMKPSDDSPFVNEIFDPESTDVWYKLPSDRLRSSMHAEYRNANYGVVNPRTLETLYELVYEQKLTDGISARSSKQPSTASPRVVLRTYQRIISASHAESKVSPATSQIILTTQHSLTDDISEITYDAVICGTGYDRTSWIRLLRSSNLAEDYGLVRPSDGLNAVKLTPDGIHAGMHEREHEDDVKFSFATQLPEDGDQIRLADSAPQSCSESSPSTPPSSPSLSVSLPARNTTTTLRISRAYRLLPRDRNATTKIYLQGCAEATHGLSDTLLSILGVRAGEVVDELCGTLDSC